MSGRPWTDAEVAEARRLRDLGNSFKEIGQILDRHPNGVQWKLILTPDGGPAPVKAAPRTRRCLCCGKEFASAGAHNRLCTTCRAKPDSGDLWRYA